MKRTLAVLAVAVLGAASLSGCIVSGDPAPPQPTTNVQVIDTYLALAREVPGVLDSQIEMLQRARAAGEVTRAEVDAAFAAHLACLDEAGVKYIAVEEETVPGSGVSIPGAVIPAPDLTSTREVDIDDACAIGHDAYVKSAYAQQPWALAAEAVVWTSPAVRGCLASHGYPSDNDATASEMQALDQKDWETHAQDPGFSPCVAGVDL